MKYIVILLLAAGMLAFHSRNGGRYYLSVKGAKQGQFKAPAAGPGGRENDGWFEISSFSLGTGKSQQKPIVIKKETDGSSAMLRKAFEGGEVLEVAIQTLDANNKVTGTTTLKKATLAQYKVTGTMEEVVLKFEAMEYAAN